MVLKSKVPDPNAICEELQTHMLKKTGFDMKFEEKPMDDCVEITEDPDYIPSYSVETVEVQYHCPDMDVLRKKYPMIGEFERVNNNTFKALGDWTCPFGFEHTQSRFITFHEHHGYCKGCNKPFHAIDPDCTDAWLKETKKKIIDELRHQCDFFELPKDWKSLTANRKPKYYGEFNLTASGEYKLFRGDKSMAIGRKWIDYDKNIKTPEDQMPLFNGAKEENLQHILRYIDKILVKQKPWEESFLQDFLNNNFLFHLHISLLDLI